MKLVNQISDRLSIINNGYVPISKYNLPKCISNLYQLGVNQMYLECESYTDILINDSMNLGNNENLVAKSEIRDIIKFLEIEFNDGAFVSRKVSTARSSGEYTTSDISVMTLVAQAFTLSLNSVDSKYPNKTDMLLESINNLVHDVDVSQLEKFEKNEDAKCDESDESSKVDESVECDESKDNEDEILESAKTSNRINEIITYYGKLGYNVVNDSENSDKMSNSVTLFNSTTGDAFKVTVSDVVSGVNKSTSTK